MEVRQERVNTKTRHLNITVQVLDRHSALITWQAAEEEVKPIHHLVAVSSSRPQQALACIHLGTEAPAIFRQAIMPQVMLQQVVELE